MTDFQNLKQAEIDKNLEFFKSKLPELVESHRGRYVLIRHQEIVGIYDTVRDAQMTGSKFFEDGIFSVQKVDTSAIDLGYFSHAVRMAEA